MDKLQPIRTDRRQRVCQQQYCYLQKDVKIVVNGQDSPLTPVYIDGKAYLPVRDAATKLGYTVNYDEANKEQHLGDFNDTSTVIKSLDGKTPTAADLKVGTEIDAGSSARIPRLGSWAQVKEQASHITTKQEEATVQIVSSKESGVLATTDEQKKLLADIQAANGNSVTVTYNTDQDTLLGPLTAVFDFNTKAFVGFNARR
ncbi:stalk domain-containing protein [Paenibacillus whitsoniae]|uniref:stalk domain-containing protein n=1 Tax=Paenibacillus whitsoniae TaxID=2496558 RepID=UPI0013DF8235|nr:stalk domain-containing protein [Paenibacillus whitsoniae]